MGRRLGQHFLVRESTLARIASAALGDKHEGPVIEIGPGKGALTKHLLDRASRVIAIEVDSYLVHYLRQKFRDRPNLEIVEADVLKTDLGGWGPATIAGNLPYYITSPILDRVYAATGWTRAVFLIQKEVAERLTAQPGSRDYGYLTAHTELFSRPEYLFTVPPAAFKPPPKVDSAVVRLTPRDPAAEWGIPDAAPFLAFASAAFRQKRKTLRNNLRESYPLIEGSAQASLRAEQLSFPELVNLYRAVQRVE